MFDDKHEYISLSSKEERSRYWTGRLVQAKIPIKKNLFERVPADMIGLVLNIEEKHYGFAYLLVVRWADGSICPCYQHSVFTHNKGERID
tara:strand:- start:470 stop:739 length:270 start_codon:yes stop_codon:yes gene_type:complete